MDAFQVIEFKHFIFYPNIILIKMFSLRLRVLPQDNTTIVSMLILIWNVICVNSYFILVVIGEHKHNIIVAKLLIVSQTSLDLTTPCAGIVTKLIGVPSCHLVWHRFPLQLTTILTEAITLSISNKHSTSTINLILTISPNLQFYH